MFVRIQRSQFYHQLLFHWKYVKIMDRIPLHILDESPEHNHDFTQPDNIETVEGSQRLHFLVLFQKANHLRLMDHNIIVDIPEAEPTPFSQPRNIAERGTSVIRECRGDSLDVAQFDSS
jgi:hypothetical protein